MELLKKEEVKYILDQYGSFDILDFKMTNYSNTLIGYLGDHLSLTVKVQTKGTQSEFKFFMKCMPKDKWISEFVTESRFFEKEYKMLSGLFKQFERFEGKYKWRPKSLLVKENLFVFEDVTEIGYKMASMRVTMNFKELKATVHTLAKFHAQSFIYEENLTRELGKPYRIWENYSEYLQEHKDKSWRNAGRDAAIEYLKINSKRRFEPNFPKNVTEVFHTLFNDAYNLMRPSARYRNTVVHRDLWSNNILLKQENEDYHALIVDFQTALYCPPTMDLASLIYFNTCKSLRDSHIDEILDLYYKVLSEEVEDKAEVDFAMILNKKDFIESFNESLVFGLTQAAIIVPIIALTVEKREELFCDPESNHTINNVSRSQEIIEAANEDAAYRSRLSELFEEIVDRYCLINEN